MGLCCTWAEMNFLEEIVKITTNVIKKTAEAANQNQRSWLKLNTFNMKEIIYYDIFIV